MIDITVVLMTHAEGKLIVPTLESFKQAINHAEAAGITIEKMVTMDNPSPETKDIIDQIDEDWTVLTLSYGDLGKVRNHAAKQSKGKYFAILDGDDFWSYNWLSSAFKLSENSDDEIIVHPELNWLFEEVNNIFYHCDEEYESFDYEALRSTNPWDSLCFCRSELVKKMPYVKRQIKEGFAYEDWNWNRRTFEKKIAHVIAHDTIIFKRRRSASQGAQAAKRGVISKPSLSSYYDFY